MSDQKPLTMIGEQFEIDADKQKVICLIDNKLFVVKDATGSPFVLSFISRIKRNGITPNIVETTPEVVRSKYTIYENDKTKTSTQNQFIQLVEDAVKEGASDIHIRVSEHKGTTILFRIDGDLSIQMNNDKDYEYGYSLTSTIYQALTDVSDSTYEPKKAQDARISNENGQLPSQLHGIRIGTSAQTGGFIMVLRLLYKTTGNLSFLDMGLLPEAIEALELLLHSPTGITLVSGPTGSGKTTLLTSILEKRYKETKGTKNLMTVEDPPEYPILGAVQTPVENAETQEERSRKFQKAISATLRLDPDTIMIGEIRDSASAQLGIEAAMTGHQVWSTIHVNTALGILPRLIDLKVQKELVTDPTIVKGLINQRLIKKLCPKCKVPVLDAMDTLTKSQSKRISRELDLQSVYLTGEGCDHCNFTGTKGRVAVVEVIVTDQHLMDLVRTNDIKGALTYLRSEKNVTSLIEAAMKKIEEGIVDPFSAEEQVGPLSMKWVEADHKITSTEIHNDIGFDANGDES